MATEKAYIACIDDDPDIMGYVKDTIESKTDLDRPLEIETFTDSREAWEAISEKDYHLIALDWKMPHISGLALMNRIRTTPRYRHIPLIVATGFLEMKDFRLLDEYPFVSLVEKPFTVDKLVNKILAGLQQYEVFNRQLAKVEHLLNAKSYDEERILKVSETILKESKDQSRIVLKVARQIAAMGQEGFAQELYHLILAHDNSCIQALTEIGKQALRDGDGEKARSLLFQAQQRSPHNLERLCLLGQSALEELNASEARQHFEDAAIIDPVNEKVRDGLKLVETVEEIMSTNRFEVDLSFNFASMMNAVGIALTRDGNTEEGIDHYKSALSYVSTESVKAKLAFNIGLGFVRANQINEAKKWFESAVLMDPHHDKARVYMAKIREAQAAHTKLPFGSEGSFSEGQDDGIDGISEEVLIRRKKA